MDTINELKEIVKKQGFEEEKRLLFQLELFRNLKGDEMDKILKKILELSKVEPTVIKHFVEGFQQTAKEFVEGEYIERGVEGVEEFVNKQEEEVDQALSE